MYLVSDTELPQNCFYTPGDTETKKDVLNTVFQIWKRHTSKRKEIKIPDNNLVKKLIPKKKKVKVYRKVKEDLFKLEGDEYVKVEKECFEKNENGPFWLGNKISLVDLHYAPFFERFGAFKELFGVEWPEECIKISNWWSAIQKRDSYKMTVLPTEEHVDLYRSIMQNMS